MGRNRKDWCDFHRTFGHLTEGCWTLRTQLKKLVQEGHLNCMSNARRGRREVSKVHEPDE
ncbi:hypothetical protein CR513_36517, partial [Mucuna pruriens]